MRKSDVYDRFFDVADAFYAAHGKEPTGEEMRQALGNTGSYSTIVPLLREWKVTRASIANRVIQQLPYPLSDPLLKIVSELRAKVMEDAQEEIKALQEEARLSIQAAQEERAVALKQLHLVEENYQTLTLKLNHTQADNTLLQKELAESKKQEQILHERVTQLNENLRQIQALHQSTVKALKESAERKEQKLESEIQQLREELEKQRHHYIGEVDAVKIAKIKAEQTIVRLDSELNKQKEANTTLEEAKKCCEIDLAVLTPALDEAKKEIANKDKTFVELKTKLNQQEVYMAELKAKNSMLEQKCENQTEQMVELKTEIGILKNALKTKARANDKR